MSLTAVAANLGVSRSTVSRWLKSHGYQVRQGSEARKRGTTIEQGVQEQIRRMNSQHIPLLEISASLQISYGRLHKFLSDEGLLWGRRIADVDLERLARLYDSGSTITDIADELNLDWKTVKSRLDKLGYSIRKADEYNRQGVDGLERQYKEMIADQNSLSTTAEKLGVSKYVLRQRLVEAGLELPEYVVRSLLPVHVHVHVQSRAGNAKPSPRCLHVPPANSLTPLVRHGSEGTPLSSSASRWTPCFTSQ